MSWQKLVQNQEMLTKILEEKVCFPNTNVPGENQA